MAIMASFPGRNLFSSVPTTAPNNQNHRTPPTPPISVPKYPPKSRPPKPPLKPPFTRIPHNRSKYYKPVPPSGEEIIASEDEDRAVIIGESGVSYRLPGAPFEFQFSYSETPKAKPLAIREPAFLPFAPPSMPRPWTGKAPLKSKKEKDKKKKIPLFESLNPSPLPGMKRLEMPGPYKLGDFGTEGRKMSREEVLGEPLSRAEVKALFQPLASDNRQVNLGRDGLTHNMLELVHSHWKRQSVCKVKCKGVPTVDMDNVCRCLEERTGGKIIHRAGGVVYLFRGRNYNYSTRPKYPVMLWKPAAPVYPKLIQDAPGGLTERQANELKNKGKKLLPICKLSKNGVYVDLVNDVRHAFEGSTLVKIDCRGLEPSDYKKIGAKLMELVPCVLLSFDNEQILMWRGLDWKSMYPESPITLFALDDSEKSEDDCGEGSSTQQSHRAVSSPRMMSLWKRALESSKALLLDEIEIGPDALLQKVEAFHGMTQAVEYSYLARIVYRDDERFDDWSNDDEDDEDNDDDDDGEEFDDYDNGSFEELDPAGPLGSLPVDLIAKRLHPGLDTGMNS